jgi:Holliday junction DNA helicase RuvA
MYAYLNGLVTVKELSHAIIECNGVGYFVKISLNTYEKLKINEKCLVYTYFHVREDAQILFGFAEESEKKMFELLLGVNGIGGNTALSILSALSVDEIKDAIGLEKVEVIKKVRGVGAKTAERLILELKDKIPFHHATTSGISSKSTIREEGIMALISLGFQKQVMEKRVDEILKHSPDISVEDLIKTALK